MHVVPLKMSMSSSLVWLHMAAFIRESAPTSPSLAFLAACFSGTNPLGTDNLAGGPVDFTGIPERPGLENWVGSMSPDQGHSPFRAGKDG